MSEHEHGHHEHEAWKADLSRAFKDLKAADDNRAARLHRNQEAVERILHDVFPAVFAQFVRDAKENGFHAVVASQQNGRQRLTLEGPTNCIIDFWTEATPDMVTVFAKRNSELQTKVPRSKKTEHFQESDLGEFLAAQLEAIRPKS